MSKHGLAIMNSVIEHAIRSVNSQLSIMQPGNHCMLLGKYDYTLHEEKYSGMFDLIERRSLALFPSRPIPGLEDMESACCCVYEVDSGYQGRTNAIRALSRHFVMHILPRMEYKYRALLHAEEVEQILSVLD